MRLVTSLRHDANTSTNWGWQGSQYRGRRWGVERGRAKPLRPTNIGDSHLARASGVEFVQRRTGRGASFGGFY
jgi:hypothetical protein